VYGDGLMEIYLRDTRWMVTECQRGVKL